MRRRLPSEICGYPTPLFAFVVTVIAAAAPLVTLALASLTQGAYHGGREWSGVGLFTLFALAADFRPVPLDRDGNEVSLAFVFITALLVLFGWQAAIPAAALSIVVPELARRRPPLRALFNSATYALAAGAGALPFFGLHGWTGHVHDAVRLTGAVFVSGGVYVLVNVTLVSRAASLAQVASYRVIFARSLRQGAGAFAIMAFLAALTANLWAVRPFLLALLAGPLFTLTLYQRSALRSRLALRDALTDNLTGLGNHRAYQARLRDRIDQSTRDPQPFSLCLIDLDDFKAINDRFGHHNGDRVLVQVAELLQAVEGGQAFRFGGDEFALLLTGDESEASATLTSLQRELVLSDAATTMSVGIATYPTHASDLDELQQVADGALYWVKRHGKNRACIYSPGIVRIHSTADLEREAERAARLRAATNLVKFLDARDTSTANHSEIVAELAVAIGEVLAVEADTLDQLRLAGLLHDLGKLGVPDRILHAPRALNDDEFEVVRRHPEIGCSLLDGLQLAPVDEWILHHHERWDGTGYPNRLRGEEIPLGARIIHVADAFEAMTAHRPYGRPRTIHAAIAELRAHAGSQFDPRIVAALATHLAEQVVDRLQLVAADA
jgi:diguanylate cyclase (GGDEF)-like protein